MPNLTVPLSTPAGELTPGKHYQLVLTHSGKRIVSGKVVAFQPYKEDVRSLLTKAVEYGASLSQEQINAAVEESEARYQIEGREVVGFRLGDVVEATELS